MARFVVDPTLCVRMGGVGRKRVRDHFSRDAFARQLEATCCDLVRKPQPQSVKPALLLALYVFVFLVLPAVVLVWAARHVRL